ncbi:hypothetical protein A2154_03785 [Candidatus Gottesmanbacteria bacterium RBG_16_43_7]|uniref:Sucrose phosphatase-like domain-containing protein n=1 Tax=Candidatus Gottesmanbacteria bacterium RBG_16_43_7 TaxID=1798373 RepID=A0A1F5Z8W0_9BACT|nr:MAG: hypothetical protein A2154_03785 [Candidatus Gottesmanbacteria bacterium RBG_16_43_7]
MTYKLVLVDLDDTLTPNLGMPPRPFYPSPLLRRSVRLALKHATIALCTGRDKATALAVVDSLGLTAPQIIEGGAKIITAKGKNIWTRYLSLRSARLIINQLKTTKTSFSVITSGVEIINTIPRSHIDKITAVFWYDLPPAELSVFKNKLSHYPDLAVNINQDRTGNTLYITHRAGTKSHGVRRLQKMLGVSKTETIGIGDGNNDRQLLLTCGLKVAMGNAVAEVKEIADYVAPGVKDDGVAHTLTKFILGK